MAYRGNEHASTMLNWAELKGKATLVLVTLLSFLRSAYYFKKQSWSGKNYRYAIRTDSDIKDL